MTVVYLPGSPGTVTDLLIPPSAAVCNRLRRWGVARVTPSKLRAHAGRLISPLDSPSALARRWAFAVRQRRPGWPVSITKKQVVGLLAGEASIDRLYVLEALADVLEVPTRRLYSSSPRHAPLYAWGVSWEDGSRRALLAPDARCVRGWSVIHQISLSEESGEDPLEAGARGFACTIERLSPKESLGVIDLEPILALLAARAEDADDEAQ